MSLYAPRAIKVSPSCGCTLTRASVTAFTPENIESEAFKEHHVLNQLSKAMEAKRLGVPESPLAMLMRGTIHKIDPDDVTKIKVGRQSLVAPFIMRPQRTVINDNYFTVTDGVAGSSSEIAAHSGAWLITVGQHTTGSWHTKIPNMERYFLPGSNIFIENWDNPSNKNLQRVSFKVVSSVNADNGGRSLAAVLVVPNLTSAQYTALSSGDKLAYNPTFGLLQIGASNVADYEDYCYNPPVNNDMGQIVNWFGTYRSSRCMDDEYKRMIEAVFSGKVNEYQKLFQWTPIEDQNKQAAAFEQKRRINNFLYGQRINASQTTSTYTSLPQITDPEDSNCVLGYKAEPLGIYTILGDNNRIVDMQGSALNFDSVMETLYDLKRNRGADGTTVDTIDALTDRYTFADTHAMMSKYYKSRYGVNYEKHFQVGQKLVFDNEVLFNYNVYDIPDHGVQLAVFHDQSYDDRIAATPNTAATAGDNFKARSRRFDMFDWSDIATGVLETNTVTRKHPNPDVMESYKCRMAANVKEYKLMSETVTNFLDRPSRHASYQNFSDGCPSLTYKDCAPTAQ